MKIEVIAESVLMVELGTEIDLAITAKIADLVEFLHCNCSQDIVEITPSYTKVMVQYRLANTSFNNLSKQIEQWHLCYSGKQQKTTQTGKLHTLPVYYHSDVAPDLDGLAKFSKLSVEQVIEAHSREIYCVSALGFAPGFAFLSSVDDALAMPRHSKPRLQIPAGSVGIAGQQTAVYPMASPGGWQIIGNCPQSLFEPQNYPISRFKIGDRIKFTPIDRQEFLSQGGKLCQVWK